MSVSLATRGLYGPQGGSPTGLASAGLWQASWAAAAAAVLLGVTLATVGGGLRLDATGGGLGVVSVGGGVRTDTIGGGARIITWGGGPIAGES